MLTIGIECKSIEELQADLDVWVMDLSALLKFTNWQVMIRSEPYEEALLKRLQALFFAGAIVSGVCLANSSYLDARLKEAAVNGDPQLTKILIDEGANVNSLDAHGNWLFSDALIASTPSSNPEAYVQVFNEFVDAGLDVNLPVAMKLPIFMACVQGVDSRIFSLFVNAKGAKLNVKDSMGRTTLYIAVEQNLLFQARALLAAGASVNATVTAPGQSYDGYTALMRAIPDDARDDGYIVKLLLGSAGIDVNAHARNGDTALSLAITAGNTALVKELIAAGAKS